VNNPEPRTENLRKLLPKSEGGHGRQPEDAFVPRYVELPQRWRDVGRRNLQWGAVTLMFALLLLGVGVFLRGTPAIAPALICLATVTVPLDGGANEGFFNNAMVCFSHSGWSHCVAAVVPFLITRGARLKGASG
jgi:hypothetical protein